MSTLQRWRRQRAVRRVKTGDGRPLQRFRWWQHLGRALFFLQLPSADGRGTVYAVDIRRRGDQQGGKPKAHLYRDGRQHAESTMPAAFPVEGGVIDVAVSAFGVRRCHYTTPDGAEHQLTPDPRSAQGRRARLDREHPTLSRGIGFLSVVMLLAGLAATLLQVAGPISQIPPVAELVGTFVSPFHEPLWLTITLALGAVLAGIERALRLQHGWLDSAGS